MADGKCPYCGIPVEVVGNPERKQIGVGPFKWTEITYAFKPAPHFCFYDRQVRELSMADIHG